MDSIVATLLALAVLAEQAAGDTPWVRWRVLWAARYADLIAREFVAGSTWNPAGRLWSPALPTVRYGTLPADALDLAASLRALAFVVMNMAAQRRLSLSGEARDESAHDGNAPHGLEAVIQRLGRAALRAVELRDTS